MSPFIQLETSAFISVYALTMQVHFLRHSVPLHPPRPTSPNRGELPPASHVNPPALTCRACVGQGSGYGVQNQILDAPLLAYQDDEQDISPEFPN